MAVCVRVDWMDLLCLLIPHIQRGQSHAELDMDIKRFDAMMVAQLRKSWI